LLLRGADKDRGFGGSSIPPAGKIGLTSPLGSKGSATRSRSTWSSDADGCRSEACCRCVEVSLAGAAGAVASLDAGGGRECRSTPLVSDNAAGSWSEACVLSAWSPAAASGACGIAALVVRPVSGRTSRSTSLASGNTAGCWSACCRCLVPAPAGVSDACGGLNRAEVSGIRLVSPNFAASQMAAIFRTASRRAAYLHSVEYIFFFFFIFGPTLDLISTAAAVCARLREETTARRL